MFEGHSRKGSKYGGHDFYSGDFRPDYRTKEPGSYRDDRENHVLLITVINPAFPITCDIVNQICMTYGRVLRVVIFKKNGVQAMVELDSVESARRVKQELHGRDVYTNCCTLRVEYAKPTRLNVYKNDSESFDFTKPTLGKNKKSFSPGDPGMNRNWAYQSTDYNTFIDNPNATVSGQPPANSPSVSGSGPGPSSTSSSQQVGSSTPSTSSAPTNPPTT
ncbi:heterogeneous nuclear ribonucleoprotein L-like [Brevipalpus obovatus]|uniref:heterogeneous nuclear ribonucleoprotein L-like n=1 Tax=Brevipalpus obovatus TaxID=246614 RepID=UPI003D9F782A